MAYTYQCHVCDCIFDSFAEMTEHKKRELNDVAGIKSDHPDWDLQQCFEHFKSGIEQLSDEQVYAHPI